MHRRNSTPLPLWSQRKMAYQNRGDGGRGEAQHYTPQVTPHYSPTQVGFYCLRSTLYIPTLLSAPIKGEPSLYNRAGCVTEPSGTNNKYPLVIPFFPFMHLSLASNHSSFLVVYERLLTSNFTQIVMCLIRN